LVTEFPGDPDIIEVSDFVARSRTGIARMSWWGSARGAHEQRANDRAVQGIDWSLSGVHCLVRRCRLDERPSQQGVAHGRLHASRRWGDRV